VKFLIDNALSPSLSAHLRRLGHNSVHVRDLEMGAAPDDAIFALARQERRILVSADTDFGALLAVGRSTVPSVILFRGDNVRRPDVQADLLTANLMRLEQPLREGSLIVFQPSRIRIRRLPLGSDE